MYVKISRNSEISKNFPNLKTDVLTEITNLKSHLASRYTKEQIQDIINNRTTFEQQIPIDIFSEKLSTLEAVVKYLKENQHLNFKKISTITKRAQTTIATTYNNAYKKHPNPLKESISNQSIPASIFSIRKLSSLESVVIYLKYFHGLKLSEISKTLKRDSRNIWTIHDRAKKKIVLKVYKKKIKDILRANKIQKQDIRAVKQIKTRDFVKIFNQIQITEKLIPISIFTEKDSTLSAVVSYLKDRQRMSNKEIAQSLNRTEPVISVAYENSRTRLDFRFSIPLKILADRRFSLRENIIHHLLTVHGLNLTQAARLLKRSPADVWKLEKRYNEKR